MFRFHLIACFSSGYSQTNVPMKNSLTSFGWRSSSSRSVHFSIGIYKCIRKGVALFYTLTIFDTTTAGLSVEGVAKER